MVIPVRRYLLGLCLMLLVAQVAVAEPSLEVLAAEYQALRKQLGHFSGGAWNDDVDRTGGRKEQVLAELGKRLGDGTYARAQVIACMGEPDAMLKPGDMMFRQSYDGKDPRVRELLVYHWRGWHDFLYFASDGTQVITYGWWAALE